MRKAVIVIMIILNLASVGYSAYYYLSELGLSGRLWLSEDILVVPLVLFILAGISGSLFYLNLSFPFLLVYGLFFQKPQAVSFLPLSHLHLLIALLDLIYIAATNIKLKSIRDLFWGLLAGCLLALIYHKIQFGADVNFQLPVLKIYGGLVEQIEKIF